MRKDFYVYIHTRLDSGAAFYVGKGSGYRAYDRSGRNKFWNRIAKKTEWVASIVQQDMCEEDAFLLERWLIAKFRHSGVVLANLSDGGEGSSGIPSSRKRTVFCSNGMIFPSGHEAANWVRLNGFPKARQAHISATCRGERSRAYGFAWSYDGIPVDDGLYQPEATSIANSKRVNCSNGMVFESCMSASKWVSSVIGREVGSGLISRAALGAQDSAYGFSWWYAGGEPKEYKPVTVSVECIGYGVFDSLKEAADWVSSVTKYKAQGRAISDAASGKYAKAYGFKWRYPE